MKSPKQAEYHPNDIIFIQSRAEINLAIVKQYTLSNSELARHCGVNDKTMARIQLEMELSSGIPRIDQRLIRRGAGQ